MTIDHNAPRPTHIRRRACRSTQHTLAADTSPARYHYPVRAERAGSGERDWRIAIPGVAIAASLVVRTLFWFRRDYGHDDFYLAYLATIRSTGARAGIDFEVPNFTPVAELLAPLFRLFPESFLPLDIARGIILLNSFILLFLVYRLARALGAVPLWSAVAVVIVTWQPDFILRIEDVRADALSASFLCGSILLLVSGGGIRDSTAHRRDAFSGLLFGVSVALSYKYLIASPFFLIALIARSREGWWKRLIAFFASTALLPLLYFAWRIAADGHEVVGTVLRGILVGRNEWASPGLFYLRRTLSTSLVTILLIAAGFAAYAVAAALQRKLTKPVVYALLTLGFLVAYVALNPFLFPYNFILLLSLFAPLVSGLQFLFRDRLRSATIATLAITLLVVSAGAPALADTIVRTNRAQRDLVRWIWDATEPSDRLWDWQGMHFGRPGTTHWYFFGARHREYLRGDWYSLSAEWRNSGVVMLIENFRFRYMSPSDVDFMLRHYEKVAPCIWLAGTTIPADDLLGGTATVDLVASGDYRVIPSTGVIIDGREARAVEFLSSGTHTVSSVSGQSVSIIHATETDAGRAPPCPQDEPLLYGLD